MKPELKLKRVHYPRTSQFLIPVSMGWQPPPALATYTDGSTAVLHSARPSPEFLRQHIFKAEPNL